MPAIPEGLPTIGKATIILLRQHGIDNAFAIITAGDDGQRAVPGVGPAKWAVLHDWARTAMDLGERLQVVEAYIQCLPSTDLKLLGCDDELSFQINYIHGAYPHDQQARWRSLAWHEAVTLPKWLSSTVHADWFRESDTLTAQDQEILRRRLGEATRVAGRIVNEAADRLDLRIAQRDAERAADKARDTAFEFVCVVVFLGALAGGAWWLFGRHH